jgi:uncharacterized protein
MMRDKQRGKIERRYIQAELRADKQGRIEGYAAVFGVLSQDLGGFRERIRHGAFAATIQRDDIRALFNHDANFVLGRNRAETLELAEDSHGLHFRVAPPGTGWADDLQTSINRGDIDQASFGFWTVADEWTHTDGSQERELIEAGLYDVSVVTFPAYTATAGVAVRQLAALDAMLRCDNCDQAQLLAALDEVRETIQVSGADDEAGETGDTAPGQAAHAADAEGSRSQVALLRRRLMLKSRT